MMHAETHKTFGSEPISVWQTFGTSKGLGTAKLRIFSQSSALKKYRSGDCRPTFVENGGRAVIRGQPSLVPPLPRLCALAPTPFEA